MVDDTEQDEEISLHEFIRISYEHQNTYIKLADQKASLILTAHVAYLGLFLNFAGNLWPKASVCLKILIIYTLIAIVGVVAFAARAVYPSTPETPTGLILWESIVNQSMEEYRYEILSHRSRDELLVELTDETYQLAQAADNKYINIRYSMFLMCVVVFGSIVIAGISYV